jgi:hypothetical protein
MDYPQYQCNLDIQMISGQQWRDMCKELGIKQAGRRDELRLRVVSFLCSQEGRERVGELAGSVLLIKVLHLLKLPSPGLQPLPIPVMAPVETKEDACVCGVTVQLPGKGPPMVGVPALGCDPIFPIGSVPPGCIVCTKCGNGFHKPCMSRAVLLLPFVCPMCQLRAIEPYEPVLEVFLAPYSTSSLTHNSVQKQFIFTEEMRKKLQEEGSKRLVQIRAMRLDEEGYVYRWPKECTILLNGKSVVTYTQPPASSSRRRKDTSLNLTSLAIGYNSAMVMKQREEDQYAFGVFLVETQSSEALFRHYSTAAVLSLDAGKAFVSSHASSSSEVSASLCRTLLKCPLTRFLPDLPVRGSLCQHIQCFDLKPYLIVQEKTKTNRWRCPLCSCRVLDMLVDKYMQAVIEEAAEAGADTAEFYSDGRYALVVDREEGAEGSGGKRKGGNCAEPMVQKKAERAAGLNWQEFAGRKASLDVVFASLCYRKAWEKVGEQRGKSLASVVS